MNHHSGLLNVRRIAVITFALLMAFAFTASIATNGADAKKKKKAKVTVKIQTKNQKNLVKAKKLNLIVKATRPTTMKVKAFSGGKSNRFGVRIIRFNKAKTKRFPLSMTKTGRKKLITCGAKTVKVVAKYSKNRRGKKVRKASRKKTLAKQTSLCPPKPPVPPMPPVPPKPPNFVTVPLGDNPERCDWLDRTVCLHPFANDYYTRTDASSPTGKRLGIDPQSTPSNKAGVHIDPTDMNRGDGFSPGNSITLKIPGLDTPAAFQNSGLVPITNLHAYDDPAQAVIVIDAETGQRHPIWTELDSNPTTVDPSGDGPGGVNTNPSNTEDVNLIIRPARNFDHGKRYIVAFRNLKNASNGAIDSPLGFKVYRDNLPTQQQIVENRRPHMESVITDLTSKAGVERSSLYMAWDFTVASAESTTGRALEIRDDAFERLEDTNLANRTIEGDSPQWENLVVTDSGDPSSNWVRSVEGKITNIPCYLNGAGPDKCAPGGTFAFDSSNQLTWDPNATTEATFRCRIPRSVVDVPGEVTPATTGTYGHGLLGSFGQVNGQDRIGRDANTVWCAVNWAGFASEDLGSVIPALADMSGFPKMVDRMQQGFVNFMYLQRALIHPAGLATDPAFIMDNGDGDESVIDTSDGAATRGQYLGISQGGIMGGALTALSPDADYGVLGVPAMNYSTLLRRSVDSDQYFKLPGLGLYANYPDEAERPLLLSLIQLLWDRGEANGYAHHMTNDPLPNTPPHEVLMQPAFSDHQVANVAAEVQARTIGAGVYFPALQPGRHWEADPFMDIDKVTDFPAGGRSFMVYYDSGPITFTGKRGIGQLTPPNENVPPRPQWGFGRDPHGDPRASEAGLRHGVTFLNGPDLLGGATRGVIEDCRDAGAGDYFAGPAPFTPIDPPEAGDNHCYANGWNGQAGLP